MQPTTKALAQAVAGNAKLSGQLVHARAVLERAEAFIEDKQVERLNPRDREEFLEQLARLKLTVTDAVDEFGIEPEPAEPVDGEVEDEPDEVVEETEEEIAAREAAEAEAKAADQERLRRIALALMSGPRAEPTGEAPALVVEPDAPMEAAPAPKPARKSRTTAEKTNGDGSKSRQSRPRLRLKAEDGDGEPVPTSASES